MTRLEKSGTEQGKPYCEEQRGLSDALLVAVRELMHLLAEQSNAIIQNDPDFGRFDDLIHVAQNVKNQAKYSLLAHIYEHKCE